MDSDRRHELETNDLKEFLDNFKDFWDKHGNKVLFVIIVALLAYAGPRYYSNWQQGKADDAAIALEDATSPDALLAVADEHELVADEARRRAADLLFTAGRDAQIANNDEEAEKALTRAGSVYTALSQYGKTVPYQLIGLDGQARVAIMSVALQEDDAARTQKWDEAKAHFEQLIELAGETYTMYAARAQTSLDKLDLLRNPVAFAPPAPKPVEPDTALPGFDLPGESGAPSGFEPVLPGLNLPDFSTPDPAPPVADDVAGEPAADTPPAE